MANADTIRGKKLKEFDIEDVIFAHLYANGRLLCKNRVLKSTLVEAIETMTHTRVHAYTKNIAPILTGCAILDQIGGTYGDASINSPAVQNGFQSALHYFCSLDCTTDDSLALYALRNSMVHEASLTGSNRNRTKHYVFRFDDHLSSIIDHPKQPWDGTLKNGKTKHLTTLNPRKFTELVESCVDSVRSCYARDRSNLVVKATRDDIILRYLLTSKFP